MRRKLIESICVLSFALALTFLSMGGATITPSKFKRARIGKFGAHKGIKRKATDSRK